ncbi:MAG: response regulator transcription factor [Deltaproteobacteria bacterium]|jgi:two-component system response regulator CpxR|nr:response regulator transcription factor [Deltaproteobacteria bacterium]
MQKILIVDDDFELRDLLSDYLSPEGYEIFSALDGQSGLARALGDSPRFDLIILDIMLPHKNGFEVLSAIRERNKTLPIIMLTAKGEPVDRIVGLEMGADDYLAKPFQPRELLARIRSLTRRVVAHAEKPAIDIIVLDGLTLSVSSLQASFNNRPLNLTTVEFRILQLLLANAGAIVSRQILFTEALGRRERDFDRSLDTHISRIRKKIWPDDEGLKKIKNVRSEGYLYVASISPPATIPPTME